ncbi:hypothetical protein HRI_002651600 [Hibiscus trionum]|uniref:Ycf20-like protein n=1 Tax=Hibiscus trionum TaxID=183268 RepID=A0A9W7M6I3_HIBTR|nr:hypothetical protein HRI_002651600 [Hibiscus trionum]
METTARLSRNANFPISKLPNSIDAALNLGPCSFGLKLHCQPCVIHVNNFSRMEWSIRSSVDDGRGFDPSSGNGGRPRLIRVIQGIQTKLGVRIQELRKNLPMKILFFLVGFYCATVIGQTGDWDILSAALALFIVEGIGALMYRASLPLLNNLDEITGFRNPLSFDLDVFALFV